MLAAALLVAAVPDRAQRPLIHDVAVSYDNKWVAVSYARNAVPLYSIPDGKKLRTLSFKPTSRLIDIEVSQSNKTILATNHNYGGIYTPIWSTETWKEVGGVGVWVNKGYCLPAVDLEYADKGRLLFGKAAQIRSLICWDPLTGVLKYQARATGPNLWLSYATSPVSSLVAVRDPEAGTFKFWDVENREENRKWGRMVSGIKVAQVRSMRFSKDGQKLLVVMNNRPDTLEFKICRPMNGWTKVGASTIIAGFDVRDLDWSPDGKKIYFTGMRGQILAYDTEKRGQPRRWVAHGGQPVKAAATDMTGNILITGGGNTVCYWDTRTYKLLKTIRIGG